MANLRALVCDDEAPLRDLMARRLEKMGLDVERAESGTDAATRINEQHYDLLVTDIYMPDVTGLQLLQQMKALDPHAQVVVVTASATLDNAVGALNHGAFAYLTKPFDHLTVFDNVVARAVEFRKALLDNLRMGVVQRRRGDLLEEEITGRIRQVKRAQEYLVDLLACLPVGVAVLDAAGRVDLINPSAESALESVLAAGPEALRALLERLPLQGEQRRGEVELGGRRLDLNLMDLPLPEEGSQQVLVIREPESAGPSMGTLVQDTLIHLRGGLSWLARREKDPAALKILGGMGREIASLATFLDVVLPAESLGSPAPGPAPMPTTAAPPEVVEVAPGPTEDSLAPAVIPPAAKPAEAPGNGRDAQPPNHESAVEALPPGSGSQMLRKGMTMVLEGRLRKRRASGTLQTRPQDAERMQAKIDRWARSGAPPPESEEGEATPHAPTAWPPPLPSSSGKS
jgi:CheY-like chemotaxis protein